MVGAGCGGRKQYEGAAVVKAVEPCLPLAKRLDPVGDGKGSRLSLDLNLSHILGTQS